MSIELELRLVAYSAGKLEELCGRIETCIAKLTPEQVWMRHGENENAAANLILHLTGNVRQWILSGIGGAANTRVREREFTARGGPDRGALMTDLRSTVEQTVALLRSLPPELLEKYIDVQGDHLTVLEAIFHVVEHFSGHSGQIVFLTKFLTGEDLGFYRHLNSAPTP